MEPTSETVHIGSQSIGWHVWQQPQQDKPKDQGGALVIVFHGFLAHGRYPTVRYAAELCAAQLPGATTVVAADMPGHGLSDGLRGYLPGGAEGLITNFGQAVLALARSKYDNDENKKRKIFLVGSSMGGTIALQVALREPAGSIAGVVLLAPMLKLSVSTVEEFALSCLAMIAPQWQIIPSSSTSSEKQYRDAAKRQECDEDPHTVKASKIRVGSALTCVQLARSIHVASGNDATTSSSDHWTKFPVWNGVADQDQVVDKSGSLELHDKILAAGGSCTTPVYPALHGLLCEPSPLYDQITNEMISWMEERL